MCSNAMHAYNNNYDVIPLEIYLLCLPDDFAYFTSTALPPKDDECECENGGLCIVSHRVAFGVQ